MSWNRKICRDPAAREAPGVGSRCSAAARLEWQRLQVGVEFVAAGVVHLV